MTLWLYLRMKLQGSLSLLNLNPSVHWFRNFGLPRRFLVGVKMTSFQSKLNIAPGAFFFFLWHLRAISNSLSSLCSGINGVYSTRFCCKFHRWKWARFQQHLSCWSHYLPFSRFLQQQIQGYSLWSVSHIFQPSEYWNPAWLLQPTSHPASSPHIVTAILGRPPLVENRSATLNRSNACDAPGSQSLKPDCHWLNGGNEDILWNAMK